MWQIHTFRCSVRNQSMKRCCRQLNICWLQSNGRWDGMHWWQAICHKGLTNNKNPHSNACTHSGVTSLGTHQKPQHDWGSRIQHLHLGQGGGDRFQCHSHDFSRRWLLPPSSWRRGLREFYRPPRTILLSSSDDRFIYLYTPNTRGATPSTLAATLLCCGDFYLVIYTPDI